jgi:hypothetical protein
LNLTNGYSILHKVKVEKGLVPDSYFFFATVGIFTLLAFLTTAIYSSVDCMSEIEETSNIAQCFHSGQNELAPAAAAELLVLE